jgi:hypothetical protein
MSAPAVPIVGQNPTPQQLRGKIGHMIAETLEDPTIATQFMQDVGFKIVGPGIVLEQKRSGLELTPQRVVLPIALLRMIAAQIDVGEAGQDLAQLGIKIAPPKQA